MQSFVNIINYWSMKKIMFILFLAAGAVVSANAQEDKSKRPSPPGSVAVTTNNGTTIKIDYSRPYLKGRQLGVDLVPLGKVWRTGANEATTIEVNKNVTVEGKKLPAGKYSLLTIPGETESTIIISKQQEHRGATQYDPAQDALRVTVPTQRNSAQVEQFTIAIDKSGKVSLTWGEWLLAFNVR